MNNIIAFFHITRAEYTGLAGGMFIFVGWIAGLWELEQTKDASSEKILLLILFLIGTMFWAAYAIGKDAPALLIWEFTEIIAAVIYIIRVIHYKRKGAHGND